MDSTTFFRHAFAQLYYLRFIIDLRALMLTKNKIKFIRSLRNKRERYTQQQFIIEGEKIVKEAIASGCSIEDVISLESSRDNITFSGVITASKKDMERITSLKQTPGVLAIAQFIKWEKLDLSKGKYIVLDGVNDPGNLGTIIRIADWYAFDGIICSTESVDVYNPKVVQSSMGSIFRIPVHYADLNELLSNCSLSIFAADMEGEDFSKVNFPDSGILLMGNESHGVSETLLTKVNHQITIPRIGSAESLNVSVATGILCEAFTRK